MPTPRGGSATGPSGSQEPRTSTSTSPCLTSGIPQTWWSCSMATPTMSWCVSTGETAHLRPLTSLWISSFCISSLIASIRPRDLPSYTKVRSRPPWAPPLHLIMMCGPQVVLACQELPNQLAGFPTSCFITYACCMIQKRDATCEFCCFSHSHGSFHGKAKRITKRAEIGRIRRFQRGHLVHPPVSEQPCQLPEPGSLRPS